MLCSKGGVVDFPLKKGSLVEEKLSNESHVLTSCLIFSTVHTCALIGWFIMFKLLSSSLAGKI